MTLTIEQITEIKRGIVDKRVEVKSLTGMERAKMLAEILTEFAKVKDTGDVREMVAGEARQDTSVYYAEKKRGISRQKLNDAAMEIVRRVETGEIKELTPEDKATLAQYTGCGGGLIRPDGKKGSAYEYYTPRAVAEGVWDVLAGMGFSGGRVLDPCAGTGIFGATSPRNCAVDAVELSEFSGKVNSLVNDGPGYMTRIGPFEDFAANTSDEVYDAAVTNVPFGSIADRGANAMLDTQYRDQPLEVYFILRALKKVRPGGIAAFLAPTRCVSGKDGKQQNMRVEASLMAEFLGAYRLPSGTFSAADTDVVTDILFFRKFSEEMKAKVDAMFGPNTDALKSCNVLWEPFVSGDYFRTAEGQKYIFGETTMTKNRFGDMVETVVSGTKDGKVNPADIKDLMKLKRLPGSRIDWKRMQATEAAPRVYKDGDIIQHAGCTLQMQDGMWVQIAKDNKAEIFKNLEKVNSAYRAFEADVSYKDASELYNNFTAGGHEADLPRWFRTAFIELSRNTKTSMRDMERYWSKVVIAFAVEQVMLERAEDVGCNYILAYPKLSSAMQSNIITKTDIKAAGMITARAMQSARNQYPSKKEGYSAIWRGDVEKEVRKTQAVQEFGETKEAKLANLAYERQSQWLRREDVEKIYGEGFDPIGDSDWAMNARGEVCRASDYYYGNYAEFTARLDTDIAAAATEEIKAKLLAQKAEAETRLRKFDASKLEFNFRSPYLSEYDKLEFLRNFVYRDARMRSDLGASYASTSCDGKTRTEKLLNSFDDYLKAGTISLGNRKFYDSRATPEEIKKIQSGAMMELREMIHKYNSQLNDWVHANSEIMERINQRANKPGNLFFKEQEDGAELVIPGLKTKDKDGRSIALHEYQNAFVRKMGHSFEGINAFGVGLGKTFTALAAVQHVQAMGAKKKTLFVVPNAVLSNWRKEAEAIYSDTSDCLYVGLRAGKNGKMKVVPSAYAEDLLKIRENRHSKIFMSITAFELLRLKEKTLEGYGQYMRSVDKSLWLSNDEAEEERRQSRVAKLLEVVGSKKNATAPYIEDLGIDSLVIDEAHFYKNSTNAYDFTGKRAVSMSISDASKRGLDAQVKAWYLRGTTPQHDGVLLLTATPITNSPQEIYSMMALAVGNERVNNACGGINGADDFLDTVCNIEEEETANIKGTLRVAPTFKGLQNTDTIRTGLFSIATIKGAKEVGAEKFVARETTAERISLPDETIENLQTFKAAYSAAKKLPQKWNAEERAAIAAVGFRFGMLEHDESLDVMRSPFNLIRKMQNEILDPEINDGVSVYTFSPDDEGLAEEIVSDWNDKDVTDTRAMLSRYTAKSDVLSVVKAKKDDDAGSVFKMDDDDGNAEKGTTFKYIARAFYELGSGKILLDTKNYDVQSKFEALCEERGLKLDVIASAKESALVANINKEMASPRGLISRDPVVTSPIVKQLIFCDSLAIHSKIKRILQRDCGIPASKIAIVTGQTNNEPEELLAVQNGFNAQGEDNQYQIIIANKKAEVGLNLQKGTQAIHHLTVGWTPDSIEQRNGRGARQGNATETVRIYFYDADGTFDEVKRAMVDKKGDWIGEVTNENGASKVAISASLTAKDYEKLASLAQGGAEAVSKYYAEREAEEKAARIEATRKAQTINIETVVQQREYLMRNQTHDGIVGEAVNRAWALFRTAKLTENSVANREKTDDASVIAKRAAEVAKRWKAFDEVAADIDASFNFAKLGVLDSCRKVFEHLYTIYSRDDAYSYMKSRMELQPTDDGLLHKRWERKTNDARNMIKTSSDAFERRSAEEGGYPACVAKALAEGNVALARDGRPLIVGTFFEFKSSGYGGEKNCLALVRKSSASVYGDGTVGYDLSSVFAFSESTRFDETSRSPDADAEIIYPDSPNYEAYLKRAAEIEANVAATGVASSGFSSVLPEIAVLMKDVSISIRSGATFRLKAPLFPYPVPISKDSEKRTKLWRQIAAEQSEVIELLPGEGIKKFRILDDSRIEVTDKGAPASEVLEAFIERAKARGEELTTQDLYVPGTSRFQSRPLDMLAACINKVAAPTDEDLREIYEDCEDPSEGYAKLARRGIAKANIPLIPDSFSDIGKAIAQPYMNAIREICGAKAQAAKEEAERVAAEEADALYDRLKDSDEVILSGNTYAAKETIKISAARADSRAFFKKYGVPGYNEAGGNVWTITKKAWEILKKDFPDKANILKMTPIDPNK